MAARKGLIGGLYAFRFEGREGYGLCTHEVLDGWGPQLGQLVRFFEGTVPEGERALPDPAQTPVMFTAFVSLKRMLRQKHAERVAECAVPEALQAPPRMRQGGRRYPGSTEPEPYFLSEGLGDDAMVVTEAVSDEEMASAPDLVLLDIAGVRDCFRYGLTAERNYAIAFGTHTFDPERDAMF
jgi:hypothetical protein